MKLVTEGPGVLGNVILNFLTGSEEGCLMERVLETASNSQDAAVHSETVHALWSLGGGYWSHKI